MKYVGCRRSLLRGKIYGNKQQPARAHFQGQSNNTVGLAILLVVGGVIVFFKWRASHTQPHVIVSADSNTAMFGFDLQHTHFNHSEHILNTTNVAHLVSYRSASTADYVNSSPAVANGMVYIGSTDGKLHAFDASTGKPIWTVSTGDKIQSSPTVADGIIYAGSQDHKLYALDAMTGKILWAYTTGDAIDSTPAVANGVVYVGSLDGKVYAFHL